MIPLSLADRETPQVVRRVGGTPDVKRHLETLGFTEGCEVFVVNSLAGNLIVKIRESRIAVSEELTRKIFVEPLSK